jgi:hypothetical protein
MLSGAGSGMPRGDNMSIVQCRECYQQVSSKAKVCPFCGIKNPSGRLPMSQIVAAGFCAFIVFAYALGSGEKSSSTSAKGPTSPTAVQPISLAAKMVGTMPPDQVQFVAVVNEGRENYQRGAANEMARGAFRPLRAQKLCNVLPRKNVGNWVGIVDALSTNNDGRGILSIKIDDHVIVKTWNNALSDISSDTLMKPGSAIYNKALQMRVGQTVRFSGTFFQDQTDCVRESSMTMSGAMTDPEFIFRFSDLVSN